MKFAAAFVFSGLLVCLGCSPSNAPTSGRAALDRHVDQELDELENLLKAAGNAEEEKAAYSEVDRKTQELSLGLGFGLFDSTGSSVPVGEWNEPPGRLKGGRIDIELTYRDSRLTRTIEHQIIDPENILFLMNE